MAATTQAKSLQRSTAPARRFNGVKVFSATMMADRARIGDVVSAWIAEHARFEIVDIVVTQSSDSAFHCIAISLFYWEPRRGHA